MGGGTLTQKQAMCSGFFANRTVCNHNFYFSLWIPEMSGICFGRGGIKFMFLVT